MWQHFTVEMMLFKYSFFEYTVLEWNKLDWNIQQSKPMLSFRNSLLKTGWPIPKPIYNIHNLTGLAQRIRLRLGLSYLSQDKFNHNFRDFVNPLRPCCLEIESPFHFSLHCLYFTEIQKTLFDELLSVDENTWNQSEKEIVKLLLYGNQKFKLQQSYSVYQNLL